MPDKKIVRSPSICPAALSLTPGMVESSATTRPRGAQSGSFAQSSALALEGTSAAGSNKSVRLAERAHCLNTARQETNLSSEIVNSGVSPR
ncbi:hypothetical protein CN106_25020 [Sinorhizobium meliloti]|nr:hypothetical protein CN127_29515 [Sinorhizobium meliloti]RVN62600.1 hypothetical protein CN106_25020 [Sinorhizobium meliloti]